MITPRLSTIQLKVLEWLVLYPEVRIFTYHGGSACWNMRWASEKWRLHAKKTLAMLDMEVPDPVPHRQFTGQADGTPRLTTATFKALDRLCLIYPVEKREETRGLSEQTAYQISPRGKAVLEEICAEKR
jgi:hypothetical protein